MTHSSAEVKGEEVIEQVAQTSFPKDSARVHLLSREPIPILALGGGLTAVGVLRCLGRRRLPIYSICPSDGFDFSHHSRWYRELPGTPKVRPADLADFLRTLSIEQAVLMPCADDWLLAVSDLPPDLSSRFPSSIPTQRAVRSLVDKWEFAKLLHSLSAPSPVTRLVQSYAELASTLGDHFEPQILKPLSSKTFREKYGVKGYVLDNRTDALNIASRLEFPIMLQEYIPGPPTTTYHIDGFVDRHGRVCARFARRRLRLYPRQLGNSSMMITVPLAEVHAAVETLERLLIAVSYRGIFDAEFKYDYRDGVFKIIEINARPWWYIAFAASCGVDVTWLAYRDALCLPVSPLGLYEAGCRCVYLINDLQAFGDRRYEDHLKFLPWARSVLGARHAVFAWDDPGPAIATATRALRKGWLSCFHRQVRTEAASEVQGTFIQS